MIKNQVLCFYTFDFGGKVRVRLKIKIFFVYFNISVCIGFNEYYNGFYKRKLIVIKLDYQRLYLSCFQLLWQFGDILVRNFIGILSLRRKVQ